MNTSFDISDQEDGYFYFNVTIYDVEDSEIVHKSLTSEGAIDNVGPSRIVECTDRLMLNSVTTEYKLTLLEAENLENGDKVLSVDLSPIRYPEFEKHEYASIAANRYPSTNNNYLQQYYQPTVNGSIRIDPRNDAHPYNYPITDTTIYHGNLTEQLEVEHRNQASSHLLSMTTHSDPWVESKSSASGPFAKDDRVPSVDISTHGIKNTHIPEYTKGGKDVDLIIIDDGVWFGHPEFMNKKAWDGGVWDGNTTWPDAGPDSPDNHRPEFPNQYRGGNALSKTDGRSISTDSTYLNTNGYADGACDILDLFLDGPYYLDPEWFDDEVGRTIIRWDGTRVPTEQEAVIWWKDSSKRSTKFKARNPIHKYTEVNMYANQYSWSNVATSNGYDFKNDTTIEPLEYTRRTMNGSNTQIPLFAGHGTRCASLAYGRTHGAAYNSFKWSIQASLGNPGFRPDYIMKLVHLFHLVKPVNGDGEKRPTVTSNSYAGTDYGGPWNSDVSQYHWRGKCYKPTKSGRYQALVNSAYKTGGQSTRLLGSFQEDLYQRANSTTFWAPPNEASDAGVINIHAAGNSKQQMHDSSHPDFDNYYTYGTPIKNDKGEIIGYTSYNIGSGVHGSNVEGDYHMYDHLDDNIPLGRRSKWCGYGRRIFRKVLNEVDFTATKEYFKRGDVVSSGNSFRYLKTITAARSSSWVTDLPADNPIAGSGWADIQDAPEFDRVYAYQTGYPIGSVVKYKRGDFWDYYILTDSTYLYYGNKQFGSYYYHLKERYDTTVLQAKNWAHSNIYEPYSAERWKTLFWRPNTSDKTFRDPAKSGNTHHGQEDTMNHYASYAAGDKVIYAGMAIGAIHGHPSWEADHVPRQSGQRLAFYTNRGSGIDLYTRGDASLSAICPTGASGLSYMSNRYDNTYPTLKLEAVHPPSFIVGQNKWGATELQIKDDEGNIIGYRYRIYNKDWDISKERPNSWGDTSKNWSNSGHNWYISNDVTTARDGFMNGTSAACPIAAGWVACLLTSNPTYKIADVRNWMDDHVYDQYPEIADPSVATDDHYDRDYGETESGNVHWPKLKPATTYRIEPKGTTLLQNHPWSSINDQPGEFHYYPDGINGPEDDVLKTGFFGTIFSGHEWTGSSMDNWLIKEPYFDTHNKIFIGDMIEQGGFKANADIRYVDSNSTNAISGNVMYNDDKDPSATYKIIDVRAGSYTASSSPNAASVGVNVNSENSFGTLKITFDGSYLYELNSSKFADGLANGTYTLHQKLDDVFSYTVKENEGSRTSTAKFTIEITIETTAIAIEAVDDTFTIKYTKPNEFVYADYYTVPQARSSTEYAFLGNILENDTKSTETTLIGITNNDTGEAPDNSDTLSAFLTDTYGKIWVFGEESTSTGLAAYIPTYASNITGILGTDTFRYTLSSTVAGEDNSSASIKVHIKKSVFATDYIKSINSNTIWITYEYGNVKTANFGTDSSTSISLGSVYDSSNLSVLEDYGHISLSGSGVLTFTLNSAGLKVSLNTEKTVSSDYTLKGNSNYSSDTSTAKIKFNITGKFEPTAVDIIKSFNASVTKVSGSIYRSSNWNEDTQTREYQYKEKTVSVGNTLNGLYGDLVIQSDGDYTYTLNALGLDILIDATRQDLFSYKIALVNTDNTNAYSDSIATLKFITTGSSEFVPYAYDDEYPIDSVTQLTLSADVMDNDTKNDDTEVSSVGKKNSSILNSNLNKTLTNTYGSLVLPKNGFFTYSPNYTLINKLEDGLIVKDEFEYTIKQSAAAFADQSATAELTFKITGSFKPIAVQDIYTIDTNQYDAQDEFTGNIMSNDTVNNNTVFYYVYNRDSAGNPITRIANSVLIGDYGDITIQSNGDFKYKLNNNINNILEGSVVRDSFIYAIRNPAIGNASEIVSLTRYIHFDISGNYIAPVAEPVIDNYTMSADDTYITGNVADNDTNFTESGAEIEKYTYGPTRTSAYMGANVTGGYGQIWMTKDGNFRYWFNDTSETGLIKNIELDSTLVETFTYHLKPQAPSYAAKSTDVNFNIEGTRIPIANDDTIAIHITEKNTTFGSLGNLWENDTTTTHTVMDITAGINGWTNTTHYDGSVSYTNNGTYGVIKVQTNGDYSYQLFNSNMDAGDGVSDIFKYRLKIVKGTTLVPMSFSDYANITFNITTVYNFHPVPSADYFSVDLSLSSNNKAGNILLNDVYNSDTWIKIRKSPTDIWSELIYNYSTVTLSSTYGDLAITGSGTFTYTPNATAHLLTTNTNDFFRYTLNNSGSDGNIESTEAVITFTIMPEEEEEEPDFQPIAIDDTASVSAAASTSISGNFLTNDTTDDETVITYIKHLPAAGGETKLYVRGSPPADNVNTLPVTGATLDYGDIDIDEDGNFNYTPNAGAFALDEGEVVHDNIIYEIDNPPFTNSFTGASRAFIKIEVTGVDNTISNPVNDVFDIDYLCCGITNTFSGNIFSNDYQKGVYIVAGLRTGDHPNMHDISQSFSWNLNTVVGGVFKISTANGWFHLIRSGTNAGGFEYHTSYGEGAFTDASGNIIYNQIHTEILTYVIISKDAAGEYFYDSAKITLNVIGPKSSWINIGAVDDAHYLSSSQTTTTGNVLHNDTTNQDLTVVTDSWWNANT